MDNSPNPSVHDALQLPSFPAVQEMALSEKLLKALAKNAKDAIFINKPAQSFVGLQYYVSDAALTVICKNIDQALVSAGFKALSPKARLSSNSSSPTGNYTKEGSLDLLILINYAKTALEGLKNKHYPEDDPMQEFMALLKSTKYVITIIGSRPMAATMNRYINQKPN